MSGYARAASKRNRQATSRGCDSGISADRSLEFIDPIRLFPAEGSSATFARLTTEVAVDRCGRVDRSQQIEGRDDALRGQIEDRGDGIGDRLVDGCGARQSTWTEVGSATPMA